jgi:hypothetical protein
MSSFGMYYESLWDIKESPEEELSRLIQFCFSSVLYEFLPNNLYNILNDLLNYILKDIMNDILYDILQPSSILCITY